MSHDVTVELCDIDFGRVHQLQTGSFEGVLRRNQPGQWRIEGHLDEVPPDVLFDTETVVVRDEARILFVGERLSPNGDSSVGGTMRSINLSEGRRFVIEGADCWAWLESRLIFPDPDTDEGSWTQEVDARAGVGSDVVEAYIEAHAGTAATLTERRIDGLTVQNPSPVGTEGEWSGRLQSLAELVQRVATESGLVVHPTLNNFNDRTPIVYVREAANRSADVVIADIADLAEAEQRDVPARSTWVLAAGSGEGTSRMFRSAGGGSGRRRIERVVEARNAQTSNELYQVAEARRREDGFAFYVSGRINEAAAEQYRYLYDYDLGDIVSVQVQGLRFPVPITEVTLRVDPDRVVATPTLGEYTPDRLRGLRKDLLGLEQRFTDNIA